MDVFGKIYLGGLEGIVTQHHLIILRAPRAGYMVESISDLLIMLVHGVPPRIHARRGATAPEGDASM